MKNQISEKIKTQISDSIISKKKNICFPFRDKMKKLIEENEQK